MPADLTTIEYASLYGALSSQAAEAGSYAHAHILRELSRSTNRLAGRGNYLVHEFWDKSGSGGEIRGGRVFYATDWGHILGPFVCERKANLRTAAIQIYAQIPDGDTVLFQVVGANRRVRLDARVGTDESVLECVGTGSFAWYTKTKIPLGPNARDEINIYAHSEVSVDAYDDSTFGTPATGTATIVAQHSFRNVGAAWIPSAFTLYPGAVSVRFLNSDGFVIIPARPVTGSGANDDVLQFLQPYWLNQDQVLAANGTGVTFELVSASAVRIAAVVLREEDSY